MYTQCKLQKGTTQSVAFIPTKFAYLYSEIKIKKNNEWEDDWIVKEVYETVDENTIKNQSHKSKDIWTATSGPCPRGNK